MVLDGIEEYTRSLDLLAQRARMVPEIARPEWREGIVMGYRVVFRVEEKLVRIVSIFHGSRDAAVLLRDLAKESAEGRPGGEIK